MKFYLLRPHMSEEIESIVSEFYGESMEMVQSVQIHQDRNLIHLEVQETQKGIGKLIGRKGATINALNAKVNEKTGIKWKLVLKKIQ